MTASQNIKTTGNKIQQNKAQYKLEGQIAKISALSSRKVHKYEFLSGKDV